MKSERQFKTVAILFPKKGQATEIEFKYPPKLKTIQIPFYNHVLVDFDYTGTYVSEYKVIHYFKEVARG